MSYTELLIGCGHARDKRVHPHGPTQIQGWHALTTLDHNPDCKPDVVYDLWRDIYESSQPFAVDSFNEIHAYEVLEHIGEQGNVHRLFHQFKLFWHWLKPDGYFCATVPDYRSLWAWGDPSHTRIINAGTLTFLSKKEYARQLGKTSMSDFRSLMGDMDFDVVSSNMANETFRFILRAVK